MLKQTNNPQIRWKKIGEKECLYFKFTGIFRKDEAEDAVEQWKDSFAQKHNKSIVIWNCLNMDNYEATARVIWQNTIKELKTKIDTIWVVTNSTNIQAGAEIISFFTSYTIKVVRNREELERKLLNQYSS